MREVQCYAELSYVPEKGIVGVRTWLVDWDDVDMKSPRRLCAETPFFLVVESMIAAFCWRKGDIDAASVMVSTRPSHTDITIELTSMQRTLRVREPVHDVASHEHLDKRNPHGVDIPALREHESRLRRVLRHPVDDEAV